VGSRRRANHPFVLIDARTLENLDKRIQEATPLSLLSQSVTNIRNGAIVLDQQRARLSAALDQINRIAHRRDVEFDASPAAIDQLARGDGIEGVLPNITIEEAVIREAQRAAEYLLADIPIAELVKLQHELRKIHDRIRRALMRWKTMPSTQNFLSITRGRVLSN